MLTTLAIGAALAADPVRLPVEIDERWGFVDGTGALVVPATFDTVSGFAEGRFAFESGVVRSPGMMDHTKSLWGIADGEGKVVAPPQWLAAYAASEGRIQVKCPDGHWAYVDLAGKPVVPCTLWRTTAYAEGRAVVEVAPESWAVLDRDGRVVFALPADADMSGPSSYSEGLLAVELRDGTRFYDRDGKVVFTVPGFARDVSDGLALFLADGKWGAADTTGRVVIPPTFERIWPFEEGVAPALAGGKWGLVDRAGRWRVEPRFASIHPSEGLAFASEDGKAFGYVDYDGKQVLPAIYGDPENAASGFHGGYALVVLPDGREGWIDRAGKVIWPR